MQKTKGGKENYAVCIGLIATAKSGWKTHSIFIHPT